jgi:hypothetical protein
MQFANAKLAVNEEADIRELYGAFEALRETYCSWGMHKIAAKSPLGVWERAFQRSRIGIPLALR